MTVNARAQVFWNGDTADLAELRDLATESTDPTSGADLPEQGATDQLEHNPGS